MADIVPDAASLVRTPDQRLRVFISSTLGELAPERAAVRAAIERLHLSPVLFEDGARPHAPRTLYRAYLAQSHVFVGIYWQRYGWIAEGENISGIEDEYRLAGSKPRLLYIKDPAPEREERLGALMKRFQADDQASYKRFGSLDELVSLVERDLVLLLSERFEAGTIRKSAPLPHAANTPVPLTRTLGRAREIAQVRDRLAGGTRLLTLTGPGGVGKTRLAQEAALALQASFPDGVAFVPLQTVTSASLLARVIVDRLGVRTEGIWSPEVALTEHLRGRRTLLVLDNLEQIEGVEAAVRQMLEASSTLQVLATSRRALRLHGEQEIPVPPLPLPVEGAGDPLDHQPTIELFLDRARGVEPRFAPDAAGLHAIAEICRRVDGLPLAIELAAARVRLLAPQAILDRLRTGFELLSTKSAGVPARQQTLRAALDWSHELLSPEERRLLARLSVFEGSFSLEAASAVSGDGAIDDLTGLLDSSLILPSDEAELVEPRFRMLQTVHIYAAERLAASGDADAVRKRFVAWYLQLTQEAAPHLCGPQQRDWAARLDAERANLRAVAQAALDAGDYESVANLVWNAFVFYEIRDAGAELRAWIAETVAAKPALDMVADARLRLIDTQIRTVGGKLNSADTVMALAHDVFIERGLHLEAAVTLMVQSDLHLQRHNNLLAAAAALRRSTELFASVGHDWGVARTQIRMGLLHWMSGATEAARDSLKASLVHSRRIENEPQIARALSLLAMLGSGADGGGAAFLRDAAEIVVRGRYRAEAAACLEAFALQRHMAGRDTEAQEAVSLSNDLRDQLQLLRPPPLVGALSAAGLLDAQPVAAAQRQTDATFVFLTEMLLRPTAR